VLYSIPGMAPVPLSCQGMPQTPDRALHAPCLPTALVAPQQALHHTSAGGGSYGVGSDSDSNSDSDGEDGRPGGGSGGGGGGSSAQPALTPAQSAALCKLLAFEIQVRELASVHLPSTGLSHPLQRLFLLNVYNAMVDHGCVRYGAPVDAASHAAFRRAVVYRIGGLDFSLDLLYHVVFRCNERPADAWLPRLWDSDPRVEFAAAVGGRRPSRRALLLRADAVLPVPEPHQGHHVPALLPCHVKAQLDAGVAAFCARHVVVDAASGRVVVPPVFNECRDIFGGSSGAVLAWLAPFVPALAAPRPHGPWVLHVEQQGKLVAR
jgi:hypothetical protein